MSMTRRGFLSMLAAAGSPGVAAAAGTEDQVPAVPKRKFGRHDELVSVVGLGGHTLAMASSAGEAEKMARHAIERGITFFDNAWDYHEGRAEEWMGMAMAGGWRDRVFLMTKVCTHGSPLPRGGREGAMKMLEESLKRLKTDRLDLWMVHQLENAEEVEKAYGAGGVLEAFDQAKKDGKIRYTGFTGHSRPEVHIKMIEGGYPFDASLMPVSAVGALSSRGFEEEVMPALAKHRIAVLGMKGFGGSRRASLHGLVNAEKVLRYSLSYPDVCTHVVGLDKIAYVDEAVLASAKTPMTPEERQAFAVACAEQGGAAFAVYLQPGYRDGEAVSLTAAQPTAATRAKG
jgi:aryl-alcohol dehydrogenase-like predicted oxidoreductase